jgi:hypothetical protein
MIICKLYYMNRACFLPKKVLNVKLKEKGIIMGSRGQGRCHTKECGKTMISSS